MNSPNPKTASQPKITPQEHDALGEAIAAQATAKPATETPAFEEEEEDEPLDDTPPIPRHSQLRTLYVTEQSAQLTLDGGSLCIRQQGSIISRVPIQRLDQVVLMGNVEITTPLMNACLRHDIPIALLSRSGQFRGIIDDFDNRNTDLQRLQFHRIDAPGTRLNIARGFVRGKLLNSATLLNRYARSRNIKPFREGADKIKALLPELERSRSPDMLRGYEGMAANYYFNAWRSALGEKWQFAGRQRRPAPCPLPHQCAALIRLHTAL